MDISKKRFKDLNNLIKVRKEHNNIIEKAQQRDAMSQYNMQKVSSAFLKDVTSRQDVIINKLNKMSK